jgi:hypothetical protein
MITEELLMYLLFQLIIFVFNLTGYKRMPVLLFFTIIATLLLTPNTIIGFGDYYMMGFILILINISFAVIGLTKAVR